LGGDLGINEKVEAVEGGGLTGLLKALFLESASRSPLGPQVKVVDAPLALPPDEAAELVCRELALAQASVVTGSNDETRRRYADVEVCALQGARRHVFVERAPLAETPDSTRDSSAMSDLQGSVWVATGAARGITEYVARGLAQRYGLKMHLIGSTVLPARDLAGASEGELAELRQQIEAEAERAGTDPQTAWVRCERGLAVQRTLRAWSTAGLQATYHACDVSDRAQLAAVFARVRGQDGPVAGLLHGAGLEHAGWFAEKDPAAVRATLAVKALGMAHLLELTRNDPLRWCLAFASLSGRFGNNRQTDYAMANDLLAKQIAWLRGARPDCRSVAFHWPGWSEVGMAARPASKANLERIQHHFVSPAEGLAHVVRELEDKAPSAEVVVIHGQEVPQEMRFAPADRPQ
jgi:NAD(P)-dependent dehydrogenase (short-subunit alcohol dehydrogenase family)